MFQIEAKLLEAAIASAKQLKAGVISLYAGKHGVLFGTRSEAGEFLSLLSKEKQREVGIFIGAEELLKAIYQTKAAEFEIAPDSLTIKATKGRSIIRLAVEALKEEETSRMAELWEGRTSGNSAPQLAKMLAENREMFIIKDHVGGKPVPVHIRWNKEGVAAGMSDMYHGVSIKTNNAPTEKKNARELFVYSSWLPLLIDYLAPPEPKKGEEKAKIEKALLHISDTNIAVSTARSLLRLQAIVPGADVISLDDVAKIASKRSKNRIKLSLADCNVALRRAMAVLKVEDAIKFVISEEKPERLRIEGTHSNGSRIIEEITTSRAKSRVSFSSTIYNLLDITNSGIPECEMSVADKAILFSFDYAAKSDTVYQVDLFSAMT